MQNFFWRSKSERRRGTETWSLRIRSYTRPSGQVVMRIMLRRLQNDQSASCRIATLPMCSCGTLTCRSYDFLHELEVSTLIHVYRIDGTNWQRYLCCCVFFKHTAAMLLYRLLHKLSQHFLSGTCPASPLEPNPTSRALSSWVLKVIEWVQARIFRPRKNSRKSFLFIQHACSGYLSLSLRLAMFNVLARDSSSSEIRVASCKIRGNKHRQQYTRRQFTVLSRSCQYGSLWDKQARCQSIYRRRLHPRMKA